MQQQQQEKNFLAARERDEEQICEDEVMYKQELSRIKKI